MGKLLSIKMLLLIFCIVIFSCSDSKQKLADETITKIEKFKTINNRLPKSLSEININETESGPIYYQVINDSVYEVWYGNALGESKLYNSNEKKWK